MRWSDGRLTEAEVDTESKSGGRGVFSTVGCRNGRPLLWERHRSRLSASVECLGATGEVSLPEEADLCSLLAANGFNDSARLRVVAWKRGTERWRVEASVGDCGAVGPRVAPAKVSVERWEGVPPFAGHKTVSRMPWDLARERALEAGFDDVVLADADGRILETSVANIWVVRDGVARTPPAPLRCLPGVMRGWLLDNLCAEGFRTEECDLDIADLVGADEIWLSNAVIGLRRVGSSPDQRWESWPNFDRIVRMGVPAPGWPG